MPQWRVEFYVDARGRLPAKEFIQRAPRKEQAAILRVLELLGEFGTTLAMPHARQIDGRLWELRASASRLFYFLWVEKRFVVLHGYRKKSDQAPSGEVETARRRMIEVQEAEAESLADRPDCGCEVNYGKDSAF